MDWIKLGDIASVITKGTTPTTLGFEFVDNGINFIKIESISEEGKFINDKFNHITCECDDKLARSRLQKNDILFSIAGAIGRTAIVTEDILPANTNQALALIRVPEGVINYVYLKYALQSSVVRNQFEKRKQGVAQLNISLKDIANFNIPLPSKAEQEIIVDFIEEVEMLLSLRKRQLAKLDELVKSRFVELFGDMTHNTYGWDTLPLDECFEITSSKRILKSEWKDKGIPFLRVRDMVQLATTGKINNEFFVSEEFYGSLSDSDGVPKQGDILMSATSTLGKCHIVSSGERFYFKDADVLRFRAKKAINPVFFMEQMKTEYIEEQIARTLGITTVAHFTIKAAKTINMRLPDIELQNKYAFFVEQTDKSKLSIQQSIDQLETLKKSLMQKYFR